MNDDLATMIAVLSCPHTYVCPERDREISRLEAERWIRGRYASFVEQIEAANETIAALSKQVEELGLLAEGFRRRGRDLSIAMSALDEATAALEAIPGELAADTLARISSLTSGLSRPDQAEDKS